MSKKNSQRYGKCTNPECSNFGMDELIPADGKCSFCGKEMKAEEDGTVGISDDPFFDDDATVAISRKKVYKNPIIIVAIVCIVLAIAGAAGYFLLSDSGDSAGITIAQPASTTLAVGESITLNATVEAQDENGTIAWSSSDESIATVTPEGKVEAVKEGSVTITASCQGGKASVDLTVSNSAFGIVQPERTTLAVGENITLKAREVPQGKEKSVVWNSSDESVLKISQNGEVTALKPGTANVVVACDGQKQELALTVVEFKINQSQSLSLSVGQETTISVTMNPQELKQDIMWNSSDNAVATVTDEGKVKALKAGTATLTANFQGLQQTVQLTVGGKTQAPAQPKNYGTVRLSYGSYTGPLKDGAPHGDGGTVKISRDYKLVPTKDYVAKSGEEVRQASYRDGVFLSGYLYQSNGQAVYVKR